MPERPRNRLPLPDGGRLATRPASSGRKNVSGSNSWALPPYNRHPVSSGSPRHRETQQLSLCAATSMSSATRMRGKRSDQGRQPLGGITMESFRAGIFNELFKAETCGSWWDSSLLLIQRGQRASLRPSYTCGTAQACKGQRECASDAVPNISREVSSFQDMRIHTYTCIGQVLPTFKNKSPLTFASISEGPVGTTMPFYMQIYTQAHRKM
ncbi:uncharacterized protein [Alexandromys fortis]|uniref:uncharacterized protein n=1 Tax=Alexandromys fortis TaxID=100897 RepID=UPI002152E6C0|nr:uncharacterized protein LOC126488492 [Microtus fortis]